MKEIDFSQFEERIGIVFSDKALLAQAFTHRSYINENKTRTLVHNERLEFLGDAVLELVVTDYLFKKFPEKPEGELTAYRSALVNSTALSSVATAIGVNDFLLLSHGEAKDVGRARQYILANALEAIIGAIYIDRGYDSAKLFIEKNVLTLLPDIVDKKGWLDAKSWFQEQAQEKNGVTPSYRTLKEAGPDHDKQFTVGLFIGEEKVVTGEGKSKQEAEQDAARRGLVEKGWDSSS